MKKTFVSVVVPVYNVEPFLPECVESILAQTWQNYEVILVDDGSTDSSGKMCDDYARKNTRVRVIHKKNGGLSSARNAGIDIALGNYIAFVDSDDAVHPDYLKVLVEIAEGLDADLVACDFNKGEVCKWTEESVPQFETRLGNDILKKMNDKDVIVWVDNIKSTIRPPKRKGQYYIQTWHSTLGFKKNEEDAENLPIRYIEQAKADGKQIDLMYSDNDFRCDKYRNHFWYSGEVLKCDVPRTGALLKENKMRINKVYCELKVNPKRKIVLYAPTFRKNVDKTVYYVNADAICKMLEKKFGESFTFRLGTFQLSDIFYNTVGGVLGGLMYCAGMKARKCL